MWKNDKVIGQSTAEIYGWELPNVNVYKSTGQLKYYFFARFLLEGKVIPALKAVVEKNMLTSPISAIRPDNLEEKVQKLVSILRQNNIESKEGLQGKFR